MGVGKAGADAHLAQESFGGVGIVSGSRSEERRVEHDDMGVGKAGADAHLAQESFGGVGIVSGSAGERAQTLHALGESILDAVLHRVAGTPDDVEKLVPRVSLPEFELHPTGLLAGRAPAAQWQAPR